MATSGWYNSNSSNSLSQNYRLRPDGTWELIQDNTYTWGGVYTIPYTFTLQGWECPKCHRVNGPSTPSCQCAYDVTFDACSLCGSKSDLTPHGTKHICRRCNLKLIDEAIKSVESRRISGKTIVGE